MKNLGIGLAMIAALGIGSVLVYSQEGTNDQKNKVTVPNTTTTTQQPVVKEAPTIRTVDTQNDYPWKYLSADAIIQQQQAGQVVFLMSDAETLENSISSFSQNEFKELEDKTKNPFGNSKDKMADSWAKYLDGFIQGVEKYYPDKVDYFSKMADVKIELENHVYDTIPNLINEAKQLRN